MYLRYLQPTMCMVSVVMRCTGKQKVASLIPGIATLACLYIRMYHTYYTSSVFSCICYSTCKEVFVLSSSPSSKATQISTSSVAISPMKTTSSESHCLTPRSEGDMVSGGGKAGHLHRTFSVDNIILCAVWTNWQQRKSSPECYYTLC